MKIFIVIFLVTIIAQGATPELECWECDEGHQMGKHPCDDTEKFEATKCEKDETMCVDRVYKGTHKMVKRCASQKYMTDNKHLFERGIWEICNTTKCNTKRWTDYASVTVENTSPAKTADGTSNLECWGCWMKEDEDGTHYCNDRQNFELMKCAKGDTLCLDLVYKEKKYMSKSCMSQEYWDYYKSSLEDQEKTIWEICNTTRCNTKVWKDYFPVTVESNVQNKTLDLSTPSSTIDVTEVTTTEVTTTEITTTEVTTQNTTPDLECWGCTGVEVKGKHPCNCQKNFKLMKCGKNQNMCVDLVDKEKKYMNKTCMSEEDLKQLKSVTEGGDKSIFKICNTTKCNTKKYKDYTKCNGLNKTYKLPATPPVTSLSV